MRTITELIMAGGGAFPLAKWEPAHQRSAGEIVQSLNQDFKLLMLANSMAHRFVTRWTAAVRGLQSKRATARKY
jgi:hypothetical protein